MRRQVSRISLFFFFFFPEFLPLRRSATIEGDAGFLFLFLRANRRRFFLSLPSSLNESEESSSSSPYVMKSRASSPPWLPERSPTIENVTEYRLLFLSTN